MNRIVGLSLKRPALVLLAFALVLAGGWAAFRALTIEAYPERTPPIVNVVTLSDDLSAEEVERYVTLPIEVVTAGLPGLKRVRSISLYGLSDVKLEFGAELTHKEAEEEVESRLGQLDGLPEGAKPAISPVTPLGEILRYRLAAPPGYSVLDLKSLQDFVLRRRLRTVPGVVDVIGWGGPNKTYEISVDLDNLMAYGLTLSQVVKTLQDSNLNVGGNRVSIGSQSAVVRGVGLLRSIDDIRGTVLAQVGGATVLVGDVATVTIGHQPRLGMAGLNEDDDIVQGIVLLRQGEMTTPVIQAVQAELARIEASGILPPGVRIERLYDRGDLIAATSQTVLRTMAFGIALILCVLWLFLGNLRSALIVAATIPFALSVAAIVLVARGEAANLLAVGALNFGLIVGGSVLMVEAIVRRLSEDGRARPRPGQDEVAAIEHAAAAVTRSIVVATAIILIGFLPLFTLTGVERAIFGPLAQSYALALAGGLIAAFTVTPVLSALVLPNRIRTVETRFVRALDLVYRPAMRMAVGNRILALACALALVAAVGLAGRQLGAEFLPKLEEGNLWIRGTMPATISLEESNAYVNRMRRIIAQTPEIAHVVSQHGRPDDGTDAAGFFNGEFFAPLKPADGWSRGLSKDEIADALLAKLRKAFPGVAFNLSQYLQDNVAEAISGIKGENAVKVFGPDPGGLTELAKRVERVLATVPGIVDLADFASLGQPTIQIDIDRVRAARYGLSPGDINTTVRTAIGGDEAGDLHEPYSDRHYPIVVRLAPQYRTSIEAISQLRIGGQRPDGKMMQMPLSDVASVQLTSGPADIYREGQERYLPVTFSVRGRDLGGALAEARERLEREVPLPPGYRLALVGEFDGMQDALDRLWLTVPIAIGVIAILLYAYFASVTDALLVVSVVPMAWSGGILALALTGTPLSVSAAIGFVALLGIAVMAGILVLSHYNDLLATGLERTQAMLRTCRAQMRPVTMACAVAAVGLLPAALSQGVGSQVQKPLALVVVGGMTLAPLLILLILPVLILLLSRRRPSVPALHARPALADEAIV